MAKKKTAVKDGNHPAAPLETAVVSTPMVEAVAVKHGKTRLSDPGEVAAAFETEIETEMLPAIKTMFAPPLPAEAFEASGKKRLSGQDLAALLRQQRREKRLADRGY